MDVKEIKLRKCICGKDKSSKLEDDKIGLGLGGGLHFILAIVLGIGFGFSAILLYLVALLAVTSVICLFFLAQSHTFSCALRRACLNILVVGTFISPY